MSLFITFFFMPLSSSIVKNCSKASPSGMTETRRMTAQRQEKITIEVFMVCLSVETLGVLVWKSKWIKDDDSRRSDDEQDLSREFKYFQVSGDFETSDNFFCTRLSSALKWTQEEVDPSVIEKEESGRVSSPPASRLPLIFSLSFKVMNEVLGKRLLVLHSASWSWRWSEEKERVSKTPSKVLQAKDQKRARVIQSFMLRLDVLLSKRATFPTELVYQWWPKKGTAAAAQMISASSSKHAKMKLLLS